MSSLYVSHVVWRESRVKFTYTLAISLHIDDEGEKRKALPVRACPRETPGYGGERNVFAPTETRRTTPPRAPPPNQFHTLSPPRHCDVIHSSVSPRSHGNSAAWSSSFFYISLSHPPSSSLPLSRPQWTQPTLLHLRGYSYTPSVASIHSPPLYYYTA